VRFLLGVGNCIACLIKMSETKYALADLECKEGEVTVKQAMGKLPTDGGRRRHHSRRHHHRRHHTMRVPKGVPVKAKTLKRMLKKAGLKVSGKKSTLRSRARKAHLIRGGSGGIGMSSMPASVSA